MLDSTKPPFNLKQAIEETERLRVGSNLSNLASAYSNLGEDITNLEEEIEKKKKIREEILAMCSITPENISLSKVRELYDKAMNQRRGK